jgi:hypothetical protein
MITVAELSVVTAPAEFPTLYETVKGSAKVPSGALGETVIGTVTWVDPPALIVPRLKFETPAEMYVEECIVRVVELEKSVPALVIVRRRFAWLPGSTVAGIVEEENDRDVYALAEDTKNDTKNSDAASTTKENTERVTAVFLV